MNFGQPFLLFDEHLELLPDYDHEILYFCLGFEISHYLLISDHLGDLIYNQFLLLDHFDVKHLITLWLLLCFGWRNAFGSSCRFIGSFSRLFLFPLISSLFQQIIYVELGFLFEAHLDIGDVLYCFNNEISEAFGFSLILTLDLLGKGFLDASKILTGSTEHLIDHFGVADLIEA